MLKPLVNEIEHNLRLMNFVPLDKPKIISSVERGHIGFAFAFLLAGAYVGYSFEVVIVKYLRDAWISGVVHHTKESVKFSLLVAILNASQLVVDTCAIITA